MSKLRSESLVRFWTDMMSDFPRYCIMTPAHEVLHSDFNILTDIGSMPFAMETANQYLRLQDGDIVVTNDPYSGGTVLTSPTLIMGIGQRQLKGQTPAELLIAVRVTLMPRVGQFKSIDEEGLRIPPSPLVSGDAFNEALLSALDGHPQAPKDLTTTLRATGERLLKLRTEIKRWLSGGHIDLSKPAIKSLLQHTQARFASSIEDYREGDAVVEYGLSDKEFIKLRTELHGGRLMFDFSGTSPGKDIFLTSSGAFGICVGAVLSCLPKRLPINSGILNAFDVKTPKGSLVHSSFPQPLQLGHTDGVNLVAHTVLQSLAKIDERFSSAGSGYSHCHYEFLFEDGKHYISALPTGIGASSRGPGASATDQWRRFHRDWSVERLEKSVPLELRSFGRRANSGGDGKLPGGDGMAQTFTVRSKAEFSWFYLQPEHKPTGAQGGKTALGPGVILHRRDNTKEDLPWRGTVTMEPGDEVTLLSAGGGGFGA